MSGPDAGTRRTTSGRTREARRLAELREAEATEADLEATAARLRTAARRAVGVVGRFELGRMSEALRASRLGWYPLVALAVLGAVDASFAGALVATGGSIAPSLGIPNLLLLVYVRVAALAMGGLVVLTVTGVLPRRLSLAGGLLTAAGLLAGSLARNPWALVGTTTLACLGSGAAWTLHRPLLFDHYRPEVRVRALSVYGAGIMVGVAGAAGLIPVADAVRLTWRSTLLILAALAVAGVALAARLPDPPSPGWEDRVISELVESGLGPPGSGPTADDPELGVFERFRQVLAGRASVPLLTAASGFGVVLVTLPPYLLTFWRDHWGMGPDAGIGLYACLCLGSLGALAWFARRGELSFRAGPAGMLRMAGRVTLVGAATLPLGGAVRWFAVMVVLLGVTFGALITLLTAATVALLAAVRPANRAHASLLLGVAVLWGGLSGDFLMQAFVSRFGVRWAMFVVAFYVLGTATAALRAARTVNDDIGDTVGALVGDAEVRIGLSQGRNLPLLGVRHIDFSYGPVQVLFDLTFGVDDGQMVALLGTNGAGKSTLLRVISGICLPSRGRIHLRGSDITHLGPDERVRLGVGQVPGGRAVFGPLTVVENLRVFGHTHGRNRRAVEAGVDAGLAAFPALAARAHHPAAALSGGEQQMLGLAKAFVVRPRVLLIDELSLGLAPVVVGELLETVRRLNAGGMAVVVVEQSVNIALGLVDHAYFMERGQIRFDGPATELARRPDLLRSVFLEGAAAGAGKDDTRPASTRRTAAGGRRQ